jgi:hypothetical protein
MKTCYSVSQDALFGWSERTETDRWTMRRDGPPTILIQKGFQAHKPEKYPTKYPQTEGISSNKALAAANAAAPPKPPPYILISLPFPAEPRKVPAQVPNIRDCRAARPCPRAARMNISISRPARAKTLGEAIYAFPTKTLLHKAFAVPKCVSRTPIFLKTL